ncbi:MAG: sugar transferase [Sulfitobacter sp.]
MKDFSGERPQYGYGPLAHRASGAQRLPKLATAVTAELANAFAFEPVQTRRGAYAAFGKRALDIALVLISLPLSLPIIAICALALWREGGQPFYRQNRLGKNGRVFSILKLRTMVRDADAVLEHYLAADPELRREWDTLQKLKQDPRITPVGGFLRATSLDELPQLWNVLKGDMSLVGARPMMPEQLEIYGNPAAYFAQLPGITGLWQVSARNGNTFAFRNEVDTEYARNISFAQDARILYKTVSVVMRQTGY